MDIKDVSYFCITDSLKNIYYELNYENVDRTLLLSNLTDEVSIVNDQTMFCVAKSTPTATNIYMILLCTRDANEIFVKNALDSFVECMDKIMKKQWSNERVETKFDLIVFLINEFLYNGIILEDNESKLYGRLQKRPFESVGGIKVNRGLASILNKAAKNVKKSFSPK
ncbi:Coatomer [Nucleospora cyclopteri]